MTTHENPQEALTLNQPISFDDVIVELCDAYGLTDDKLLRSCLHKLEKDAKVTTSIVVPKDEEQLGVLHIANVSPEEDEERQEGYNFYPVQVGEKIEYWADFGYLGNLTEAEDYELATIVRNNNYSDRFHELIKIAAYPVTPTERAKRKHAAEDPSAIEEYITLDKPMAFAQAFKQICRLYSVFGNDHYVDSIKEQFAGFKDDDEVEFSLLIPGNDGSSNTIHLEKIQQDEGKKAYGYTIYPEFCGMEEHGRDYFLKTFPGIRGQLTEDEEVEFINGLHDRSSRFYELYAIREGKVTREETAELRRAKEKIDPKDVALTWLQNQPERIQYLWDKSHYGFETIEAWKKWKEKVKQAQEEEHKKYREKQIANRARIVATLLDELKAHFSKYGLVPTDKALQAIEDCKERGWTLVGVAVGESADRKKFKDDFKKRYLKGGGYDFREEDSEYAYDEDACHMPVDMFFARFGALERIKAAQEQEEEESLRARMLPLFPNVVPTESTLEYIAKNESRGWQLNSVRLDSDMSVLAHEEALVAEHGEGNVFHYQQSAKRGDQMVGVNLYFIKTS